MEGVGWGREGEEGWVRGVRVGSFYEIVGVVSTARRGGGKQVPERRGLELEDLGVGAKAVEAEEVHCGLVWRGYRRIGRLEIS